ncbi:MAG: tetratricopeptide repeat-containing sulfotransferase family protein [Candidatus Azotimanducaceae bacterium WSBS_2022_MAG_OTU7]
MSKKNQKSEQLLKQAHHLYGSRKLRQAESLYRQVLRIDPASRDALQSMVAICLQSHRIEQGEQFLKQLVGAYPREPRYTQNYVNILLQNGKLDEAMLSYQRLLKRRPDFPDIRYSLAQLLKRTGHHDQALEQYLMALQQGIHNPEEVYANISVIYSDQHRDHDAQAALQQALELNPDYIPALYNLALIREETGKWREAKELFQQILFQDQHHYDALVRLAHVQTASPLDPLIPQLLAGLANVGDDQLASENLNFALGKVCDDCQNYDLAFEHYQSGNQLAQLRVGGYNRTRQEVLADTLINTCTGDWIESVQPVSDAAPIFICGMFRSGSTLVEQMLAAHSKITAGGEINYFIEQLNPPAQQLPSNESDLNKLGCGYIDYLARTFPDAGLLTNKRPDNFLYLGLIGALFPNARIINTLRHPLDNCLSVFFQQFEKKLDYANDLLDIGHYYVQYHRLMCHWQQCLPNSILSVDYDELVRDPRRELEPLLAFIGLDWDENCLEFHALSNRVRTASTWQVRQPLHQQSSGRWQSYAEQLQSLKEYFSAMGIQY